MSSVGEKCEPMLGNRGYCTNCGNGVCKGPENACNCPKDCGGVVECTDSDGGKNYYLKGTVKTGSQAGTDSCTYCTGACPVTTTAREAEPCVVTCGAVVEYYCNNNGVIAEETFNCPNGCNEGACIGVEKVCTATIVAVVRTCSASLGQEDAEDKAAALTSLMFALTFTRLCAAAMARLIPMIVSGRLLVFLRRARENAEKCQ